MPNSRTEPPHLPLLFEKYSPQPLDSNLLRQSFNAAHDLLAVVPQPASQEAEQNIEVYRINGQLAFSVPIPDGIDGEACQVTTLGWKEDGKCLAVGFSDGVWGLFDGERGRAVGGGTCRETKKGQEAWSLEFGARPGSVGSDENEASGLNTSARAIGWGSHRPRSPRRPPGVKEAPDGSDERFRGRNGFDLTDGAQTSLVDLPRTIATLDTTKVLPRLSAIPSHGMPGARFNPEANKFATQTAVDGVFEVGAHAGTEEIDTLLVSSGDEVHVMLDETVKIGTILTAPETLLHAGQSSVTASDVPETVLHACHEHSGTHAFLGLRPAEDRTRELQLDLLDLPLDSLGGPLLHVIATNTKRMQNLLGYITQTLRCMQHDFTTGLQFPTRLISNINEELAEKEEGTFVLSLFRLAMTGHFTPTILEWLTDIVKEPNHKRWHQAVDGMYSNLLNHVIVNLMPALDRLNIAVVTLRGYARLHDGSSTFAVQHQRLTNILEGVDALRLVAKMLQLLVITEQRHFRAFSKWLRVQIDVGSAGPGSKNAIETEEREAPNLDFPSVLAYLKGPLVQSKIPAHVLPRTDVPKKSCTKEEFFKHPLVKDMSYAGTAEAIRECHEPLDGPVKSEDLRTGGDIPALLNLPAVAVAMSGHIRIAIEEITSWQSKMLRPGPSTSLGIAQGTPDSPAQITDLLVHTQGGNEWIGVKALTIGAIGEDKNAGTRVIRCYKVPYSPTGVVADHIEDWCLGVSDQGGNPIDVKFFSNDLCIALWEADDRYMLSVLQCHMSGQSSEQIENVVLHHFDTNDGFVPEKVVVGGRAGKKVCIAFGNESKAWKIFDLEESAMLRQGVVGSTMRQAQDEDVDMDA